MAHECEYCGQECCCDQDDCGGLPQPSDCRHFRKGECGDQFAEDADDFDDIRCTDNVGNTTPLAPKCPTCGENATYMTPDGTYWDSWAHYWRPR